MSYVCEKCGAQFELRSEYKEHQADHMLGRAEEKPVDELVGGQDIVAEPIVEPAIGQPGPTATEKEIESRPWNKEPPMEQRKKIGISLQYHYDGFCEVCGSAPETLELEGVVPDSSKVVVLAWCPKCKKKLHQRQVLNLHPKKEKNAGSGK